MAKKQKKSSVRVQKNKKSEKPSKKKKPAWLERCEKWITRRGKHICISDTTGRRG